MGRHSRLHRDIILRRFPMKTRRQLLQSAVGFPLLAKGSTLGLNGAVPASDRVTFATIGTGWMGGDHIGIFLRVPGVQYVAVCDLDDEHLGEAKAKIDKAYNNQDCAKYRSFEEVLLRRDIDAVSVAVPAPVLRETSSA